jgi:hypothetical protein
MDTAFYGTWSEYTNGLAFQLASDNASYVLSDGSKVTAETVTIPSVHQGKPVTAIGAKAFQGNTALSAIGWPDTITEIGDSAFAGVNGLTELTLPPSVMTLGKSCFYGCLFLRSVDFSLAEQLTVIPSDCFRKTSLSWDTLKLPLNLAEIDEGAFGEDTKLISFEIPASVTSVMGGFLIGSPIATLTVADANTAYLAMDNVLFSLDKRNLVYYGKMIKATSYTLPSQVTAVLDEAFYGNNFLNSLKQDANPKLAYLGKGCFGKMTSLRSFDFSKSAVTEIPEACFQGDSMLMMIYQAPGLLAIGKDAFSGGSLFTNLFLPETAQTFGINAFKGCAALTLYLQAASEPDSLAAANPDSCPVRLACLSGTETGLSYSFVSSENAYYLDGYTGSQTAVVIPDYYDDGTHGIRRVIGLVDFHSTTVTSLTLPETLAFISRGALRGCSALTSLHLGRYVNNIDNDHTFSGCDALMSFSVDEKNLSFSAVNGCLCNKEGTKLLAIPQGLTSIWLPSTITSIGSQVCSGDSNLVSADLSQLSGLTVLTANAFMEATALTTLTLPGDTGSLQTIQDLAFNSSGITSLSLPSTLLYVATTAFDGTRALASLTVAAGNKNYASVDGVLYSKDQKTLIHYPSAKALPATWLSTLTEIGSHAFIDNSSWTRLALPEGITKIVVEGFRNLSALTWILLPVSLTSFGSAAITQMSESYLHTFYAGNETAWAATARLRMFFATTRRVKTTTESTGIMSAMFRRFGWQHNPFFSKISGKKMS